jgi:outer membrane receptor protein involved in Fe transport
MNTRLKNAVRVLLASAAAGIGAPAGLAIAQETPPDQAAQQATDQAAQETGAVSADPADAAAKDEVIESIEVVGRSKSAVTDVVQERIEQPVVSDLVNAEQISRVGDSTVSLALRRLPGVTLVNDQFIYIRGLGERYSSTTLNGAYVPSPDLTRNVIPLDLFPAEIIDSLAVQKGFTPDQPAAFGGGSVDIRTRGLPEEPVINVQAGSGWNSDSSDKGLTYAGGSDDKFGEDDGTRELPAALTDAIQQFQGNLSPPEILQALQRDGQFHTIDEAAAINRELATSLNRNIDITEQSLDPDLSVEAAAGNSWYLDDAQSWRVGVLGLGDYENTWRNRDRVNRSVTSPDEVFFNTHRTVNQVTLTGSLSLGLEYVGEHKIEVSGLYLRNTEDDASIQAGHNINFQRASGQQLRNYRIRFEERELELFQVSGTHTLGPQTLGMLGDSIADFSLIHDLSFSWYYSDATAKTDIPNEVLVSAEDEIDPVSGAVQSTRLRGSATAADYRFTNLQDEVNSYGWGLSKPFNFSDTELKLSGGWDYYEKGRGYLQTQFGLGTTGSEDARAGTPGEALSDANILDPANGYILSIGGVGTESYLAGETVSAFYGDFDATWAGTWRLAGGVRWEDFERVSVPVDPLEFDIGVGKIPIPPEELESIVKVEDDYYPALAFTYIKHNFWAEDFQLRLGWSETTARPDLREVSDASYIDPLTEARVRGNPDLENSDLTNFDLRAEWFFANGDNFTVSAFYKDISDPIETVEAAGTDDNTSLTFINAESAELYGVEIEWLKGLGFLGDTLGSWIEGFYIAGNLTVSESEIVIGQAALNATNNKRPMTQQSDYIANVQLGFDSPGGAHSATLVYNGFSERVFFGGRNGAPDAYEQPFNSLDLIYSFYPTKSLSFKLRLQNLLDDETEIEQGGVIVLEQTLGMTVKLDALLKF